MDNNQRSLYRKSTSSKTKNPSPTDPVAFARSLGFSPDPIQCQVLRSHARRCILNCSRQWGKSTLAALIALHRAVTSPGTLVLCVSPTLRQSAELILKVSQFAAALGERRRGDGYNRASIRLSNNSRIVGLPGCEHTVRGFSCVSLLLIDEAARVPAGLYRSVRPMLAVAGPDGGDLWLMSTPNGRQGFFYNAWTSPHPWLRIEAPATSCPRFSKRFLDEERHALGDRYFRQEYLCQFLEPDGAIFRLETIRKYKSPDVTPVLTPAERALL
ncbi:MAG: hypothetical protein HYZ37_01650 [Candidatus Solibacter usitatus]|nr:hypothetical protein [Candidatus Solibacter usitatus]